MRIELALVTLLLVGPVVAAQNSAPKPPAEAARWMFPVQHGQVAATLSYPNPDAKTNAVLTLTALGDDASVTAREQADALRAALQKMAASGHSPQDLVRIGVTLRGSEMQAGVERAVAASGVWRPCLGLTSCYPAEKLAGQVLEATNAYREIDDVLRSFGLERTRAVAGDMTVSLEPGTATGGRENAAERVRCDGSILIDVEKATGSKIRTGRTW